jgi:hypothetical protein
LTPNFKPGHNRKAHLDGSDVNTQTFMLRHVRLSRITRIWGSVYRRKGTGQRNKGRFYKDDLKRHFPMSRTVLNTKICARILQNVKPSFLDFFNLSTWPTIHVNEENWLLSGSSFYTSHIMVYITHYGRGYMKMLFFNWFYFLFFIMINVLWIYFLNLVYGILRKIKNYLVCFRILFLC